MFVCVCVWTSVFLIHCFFSCQVTSYWESLSLAGNMVHEFTKSRCTHSFPCGPCHASQAVVFVFVCVDIRALAACLLLSLWEHRWPLLGVQSAGQMEASC